MQIPKETFRQLESTLSVGKRHSQGSTATDTSQSSARRYRNDYQTPFQGGLARTPDGAHVSRFRPASQPRVTPREPQAAFAAPTQSTAPASMTSRATSLYQNTDARRRQKNHGMLTPMEMHLRREISERHDAQ